MKSCVVVVAVVVVVAAVEAADHPLSDAFIGKINSLATTWTVSEGGDMKRCLYCVISSVEFSMQKMLICLQKKN